MQQNAKEDHKGMQRRSDDVVQEPSRNVTQDFQSSSQLPLLGCRASPRALEDCTKSGMGSFKSQSALCFPVQHELSGNVTPRLPSSLPMIFSAEQAASENVGHDFSENEQKDSASQDSVQKFVRPFKTSSVLCFRLQPRVPRQPGSLKSSTTTCLPEPASASNPAQYLTHTDGEVQLPDAPVQRFCQSAACRSRNKDNKVLIFRRHPQPRTDSMVRRSMFDSVNPKSTNSEQATS
jgi:hypothetical protein